MVGIQRTRISIPFIYQGEVVMQSLNEPVVGSMYCAVIPRLLRMLLTEIKNHTDLLIVIMQVLLILRKKLTKLNDH